MCTTLAQIEGRFVIVKECDACIIINRISITCNSNSNKLGASRHTVYWEIFEVQNFHDLGSISLFAKKIFAFHYRNYSFFIFNGNNSWEIFSRYDFIREICEIFGPRNYPDIRYGPSPKDFDCI